MSNSKRIYQVDYNLTFTGVVGSYQVDETDGTVDLGKHFEQVQNDIIRHLTQLDYSEGNLLYHCDQCEELIEVFDGNKGRFTCDCTIETKNS